VIDPNRVLVAGDWHGNTPWAVGVIEQLPHLLPTEKHPILLHTGDFGVWPGLAGAMYLRTVHDALADVGAQLWFIDGNHEDHARLARVRKHLRGAGPIGFHYGRDDEDTRIFWLPRGYRWTWHARTWLALGGATSVDWKVRREGISWWPQEAVTYRQGIDVMKAGKADVMLTHDCPDEVPMNLPTAPGWWDMAAAEDHRAKLGVIVDEVKPSWLIHGHYHLAHEQTVQRDYGPLHVTGLDMDDALRGNYRVLNVADMIWET
jgi:hypothetical protein